MWQEGGTSGCGRREGQVGVAGGREEINTAPSQSHSQKQTTPHPTEEPSHTFINAT